MTAADHANTLRFALEYLCVMQLSESSTSAEDDEAIKQALAQRLAALDALQHQAETAEGAVSREAYAEAVWTLIDERDAAVQDAVDRAEAAEQAAEQAHAVVQAARELTTPDGKNWVPRFQALVDAVAALAGNQP